MPEASEKNPPPQRSTPRPAHNNAWTGKRRGFLTKDSPFPRDNRCTKSKKDTSIPWFFPWCDSVQTFFPIELYLPHDFLNQKRYNTDANSFSPATRGSSA